MPRIYKDIIMKMFDVILYIIYLAEYSKHKAICNI